jgi:Carboxypeptidase regulatory-like domain
MVRVSWQRALLTALTVLAVLPSVSDAQTGGIIAGVVRDASTGVMPGVTVEVTSSALIEKVRSAISDGAGLYKVIDLPPGAYVVTFTLTGFNTVRREGISVSAGFTATVNADRWKRRSPSLERLRSSTCRTPASRRR